MNYSSIFIRLTNSAKSKSHFDVTITDLLPVSTQALSKELLRQYRFSSTYINRSKSNPLVAVWLQVDDREKYLLNANNQRHVSFNEAIKTVNQWNDYATAIGQALTIQEGGQA